MNNRPPYAPGARLKRFGPIGLVSLSLLLAGCGSAATATLPASPTALQTPLPAPTSTPTPMPTSTLAPTATAAVSPTLAPIPLSSATFPGPTEAAWPSETVAGIDTLAKTLLHDVPLAGLTVAVRQGARPAYIQGYGYAEAAAQTPAQASTVYEIASLTKQFTAAAIMQLAEQGQLQLDDTAASYLPDLPDAAQAITVRQLLNHTSGLPRNDYMYLILDQPRLYAPAEVLKVYNQSLKALSFAPGTQWEYSNMGYFWLGSIIEAVSGQTYGDYLAQHLLGPAGLASTTYCAAPPPGLAQGYQVSGPPWASAKSENLSVAFSAGGLCSTAGDLIKWQQALAGGQVVSAATYQAMTTPTTLLNGTPLSYGYGLKVGDYGGAPAVYHQGQVAGFNSILAYYPEEDLTVVLLTNTEAPIDPLDQAVDKIRVLVAGAP